MACEEKREAIIGACVNLGTRRVAEAFGVSREVVRALRSEAIRDGKLDHLKEEMGRRALGAADVVLDRIVDEVDSLPRASLAITYGILKDKGLLLTGQPTSRVEHTVATTHDDINAWVESLPSANPVSSGENGEQKGGSVEVTGELVQVLAGSSLGMTSDTPSPALCPTEGQAVYDRAKGGHNDAKKATS